MEQQLYFAIYKHDLKEYVRLIANKNLNVNWISTDSYTFLHDAVKSLNNAAIKYLLKRPDLDPNKRTNTGRTALHMACEETHKLSSGMVHKLVQDSRVRVDLLDMLGRSPLLVACELDQKMKVEMLIVYRGPELEISKNFYIMPSTKTTRLIFIYQKNPDLIRFTLQRKWGIPSIRIAVLFARVVLFTDDYLRLQSDDPKDDRTKRWFLIMKSLPMDLQMVVCNRCFDSPKNIVPTKDTELAFRSLVQFPSVTLI